MSGERGGNNPPEHLKWTPKAESTNAAEQDLGKAPPGSFSPKGHVHEIPDLPEANDDLQKITSFKAEGHPHTIPDLPEGK